MADDGEKLFEPDNNGPAVRLVYLTWPDNPNAELALEERTGDGWERMGVLEFTVGPTHAYGAFEEDGPLQDWAWTRCHMTGDRTKVQHRLVVDRDTADGVEIRHEVRREMVLGPEERREQREHDWRAEDRWHVSREGAQRAATEATA